MGEMEGQMTELVRAFQRGDLETFKQLLPSTDLSDINTTALFYTLFNSEKLSQQKEMLNMIKELQ